MTSVRGRSNAEPFFLKSGTGQCFCLFHRPAGPCRGAVLYIHPFAEEMNRSRRMAALQARELAALGYGVLQIDLHGCGDSSGDFGDARWDLWKQDIAAGAAWLRQELDQPVTLWGLRLGALLALDYARAAPHAVGAMLLWHPVLNGSAYLTQFLRLRMAGALLAEAGTAQTGTAALRDALRAGETLEIAGYDLAPELAAAIDALDPPEKMAPDCPVYWLEAVGAAGQALPPAAARVSAAWRDQGVDLEVHPVHCPPFWTTAEITVCQAWLTATSAALQVSAHAR
jgi:exosortase A-associated hydrolase 2